MTQPLHGAPSPVDLLSQMREAIGEDPGIPIPLQVSADAFPVLVTTIISLRTRDAVTGPVSRSLLERAGTPRELAALDRAELEGLLKPAGFYRQKAGQLKRIADILLAEYRGEVPGTLEELLALPGVGLKTANYVLGMVFGHPAICVDIHVHRISNRMGLVQTKEPDESEKALQRVFPREWWTRINHTMVRFGQTVCRPVRPRCDSCRFRHWCPEGDRLLSG